MVLLHLAVLAIVFAFVVPSSSASSLERSRLGTSSAAAADVCAPERAPCAGLEWIPGWPAE